MGLDAGIRRKIWALIKKIQLQNTTIVLTTHYIEEAEFLAGRVAFLDKGSIVVVLSCNIWIWMSCWRIWKWRP
ncbi:hypothetical protein [Desulfocicer niacini]